MTSMVYTHSPGAAPPPTKQHSAGCAAHGRRDASPVKSMDLVIVCRSDCARVTTAHNMASAAAASFGPNVKVLELNAQMKAVMTIIRSQECSADQFRFYADRIVRFVVESGLAEVPCESNTHTCPLHTTFSLHSACRVWQTHAALAFSTPTCWFSWLKLELACMLQAMSDTALDQLLCNGAIHAIAK
jgi:hypothetical protein